MEILNIEKEKAINAYRVGSDEQKQVLELLFGVETLKPKTVMDRVKTFEDACRELGKDHPFVLAYQNTNLRDPEFADDNIEVLAYLKLRIITAALNEGWTPRFAKRDHRYFPYFYLYSSEEIRQMPEEEKSRVACFPGNDAYVYRGVSYANVYYGFTSVNGPFGPLLVFKARELAEYAGKQFTKLYAEYLLKA